MGTQARAEPLAKHCPWASIAIKRIASKSSQQTPTHRSLVL